MENIYQYSDYRLYIRDFYEHKKTSEKGFSYRFFSLKAGFRSPNQLQLIIQGKRNLTEAALFRVAKALELNSAETNYFNDLVGFNQARSVEEKNFYYQKLLVNKKCKEIKVLERRHYEYLTNWRHAAVRELAVMPVYRGDPELLARAIWPPVSASQIKKSLDLLQDLKLLHKHRDGSYAQTSASVSTGPEAEALAVTGYHQQMLQISQKALTELPPPEFNVCGLTLGVSAETYRTIRAEVQQFQEKILRIASQDKTPEQVYQMNLQLFPLSRPYSSLSLKPSRSFSGAGIEAKVKRTRRGRSSSTAPAPKGL